MLLLRGLRRLLAGNSWHWGQADICKAIRDTAGAAPAERRRRHQRPPPHCVLLICRHITAAAAAAGGDGVCPDEPIPSLPIGLLLRVLLLLTAGLDLECHLSIPTCKAQQWEREGGM